ALARHHGERTVDRAQHAVELVTTAHDEAGRGDDAVGALAARQPRALLNPVDRNLGAAAKHGEDGAILEKVDRIVAPLAGCDLAAVEAEKPIKLAPVERYALGGDEDGFRLAPLELAGFYV